MLGEGGGGGCRHTYLISYLLVVGYYNIEYIHYFPEDRLLEMYATVCLFFVIVEREVSCVALRGHCKLINVAELVM